VSGDDFVLSWEDVLYMQLLLQHFDASKSMNADNANNSLSRGVAGPHLLLSVDPATIALLRSKLHVGHTRGPGDPPKVVMPVTDARAADGASVGTPKKKPPPKKTRSGSVTGPDASI